VQETNEAEQIDSEFMHIYQTMHTVFHIEHENTSPYTDEELNIEGV